MPSMEISGLSQATSQAMKPVSSATGPFRRGSARNKQWVDCPTFSCVLLGRGRGITNHEGNRKFQLLIEDHFQAYKQANRNSRSSICKLIVDEVKTWGRFLDREGPKDPGWFVATDDRARKKVGQALRYMIRQAGPETQLAGSAGSEGSSTGAAVSDSEADDAPQKQEATIERRAPHTPSRTAQPPQPKALESEEVFDLVSEALSDPLLYIEDAGDCLKGGLSGLEEIAFGSSSLPAAVFQPTSCQQESLASLLMSSSSSLPLPVDSPSSFSPDTEQAILDVFGPRSQP